MADSATPLIALDALAIDTETTGLDPRKAWIVELAGVRIAEGRVAAAPVFDRRLRPPEPIPPASTRIHGIGDAAVADAPTFAQAWPEFAAAAGDAVLIGHAIGYDLAVIARECARAGIAWTPPRVLDTRLLAQVAEPNLPDYSLEHIGAWLGVELAGRHSAAGDAAAAAHVFLALVPRLRAAGVRTLAEAERAAQALAEAVEQQHRAGWVTPERPPGGGEAGASRVDGFAHRYRVNAVMRTPAGFVAPDVTVRDALGRMMRERISSLFVLPDAADPRPDLTGIITERDIMRAIAARGAAALDEPVERAASRPLKTVPADAFVYLAVARMSRFHVRHLGVVDQTGRVIGALTARDLLRLRAEGADALGDEIDQATDVAGLCRAWARVPAVAAGLVAEGLIGREVAVLVSRQLCELTQRAAEIAERRLADAGQGPPPCAYAVTVLGSAGRGESLLALDQDNAIVFADGAPDGPEDRWFAQLGAHIADILHEVGVPYCKGGVMARNPQWRGSSATWRARIEDWVRRSRPEDLLSVDIFFDWRSVHGDAALADALWHHAYDVARGNAGFAKLLADAAGSVEPGLTWLGSFRTERGRIDLKKAGLFGIVTFARTLAVRHHVVARETPIRLEAIKEKKIGGEQDLDALMDAHPALLDMILRQQLADIEAGVPPSNRVSVERLSGRDRGRLREALRAVASLDTLTRDLLFRG